MRINNGTVRWKKGTEKVVESDSMYVSEFGDLIIMQVAAEHYAPDYRCTITISSLMEGQQEKQGNVQCLSINFHRIPVYYYSPYSSELLDYYSRFLTN